MKKNKLYKHPGGLPGSSGRSSSRLGTSKTSNGNSTDYSDTSNDENSSENVINGPLSLNAESLLGSLKGMASSDKTKNSARSIISKAYENKQISGSDAQILFQRLGL